MKIAVIADIHGNDVALRAVLEDCRRMDVSQLLLLGDYVGYYYRPKAVLDALFDWNPAHAIAGNHERMLLASRADEGERTRIRTRYGSGLDVAHEELGAEHWAFIEALPEKLEVSLAGRRFLLCHGAPDDADRYVYPDGPASELQATAVRGYDFVLLGHTHYPVHYVHEGVVVMNPGSVGQPRDVGGLAAYGIIHTGTGASVQRRVPFEVEAVMQQARQRDPQLPYLHDVMVRNRRDR